MKPANKSNLLLVSCNVTLPASCSVLNFGKGEMPMASFKVAVSWIALNDEPSEIDELVVEEMITIALVADLFGKTTSQVAEAVVKVRKKGIQSQQ